MLGYYKKSREEIINIIKKSPITDDGYYFCKDFKDINEKIGEKLDRGYTFSRDQFRNKLCFTLDDINAYLEKKQSKFDINEMQNLDEFLYELLREDIEKYKINDYVEDKSFTLMELIDTSIYMYYNKYKKY